MGMMGLIFTKIFKENSIICTELFRQGRLDLATYVADSQFGARLEATDPDALKGYHLLAGPIVWAMRRSRLVVDLVEVAALPWTRQMAFQEGFRDDGDAAGVLMMKFGLPVCSLVGKTYAFVSKNLVQVGVSVLSLAALRFVKT